MTKKRKLQKILNEDNTSAQETLKPQAMPHQDIDKLFDHYSTLNASRKKEFIDYLQASFDTTFGSAAAGGIGDDTALKNRKSVLAKEELGEILEDELGFSLESQEKVQQRFEEAVEERVQQSVPFRRKLGQLLEEYGVLSPFDSDDKIDLAQMLGDEIEETEAQIAFVESIGQKLVDELSLIVEEREFKQAMQQNNKRAKRSTINESMLEPTNDDPNLFNEEDKKPVKPEMRRYLSPRGKLWGIPDEL